MSGIICWLCFTSAISALQLASLRWQNELNKDQETNVSQPHRDPWWIWPRGCLRSCLLQLHQTRWGPRMDIKILKDLVQVTIERGNLCNRHHQVIQKRIIVDLGLLKSGKVELRSTIDRGSLRKCLGVRCEKLTPIVRNFFSSEMRILQGTESWFTIERGNLCQWITKNRLNPQISSWKVTQQNLWTKTKTKCEKRQKRTSNVADSGEEHSIIWWLFMAATMNAATFSWERISRIIKIPLWIKQISPWRKCSTYLQNWWANKLRSSMWIRFIGKTFMETSVIDWWRNRYQSSTPKSLRLLRFCVVLEGSINIRSPKKLGRSG